MAPKFAALLGLKAVAFMMKSAKAKALKVTFCYIDVANITKIIQKAYDVNNIFSVFNMYPPVTVPCVSYLFMGDSAR